jgi:N-acetylneuraminic acid mutarotase
MLLRTTTRLSGEKFYLRKFYLIFISLAFASIHLYAQSGAWIRKADLPKGGGSASVVNNKIYVIGGSIPGSLTDVPYNLVFDPVTDTWEEKAPMPTARGFLATAVVRDTIYAIGGGYPTSTNKNEAYDPVTNLWTTKANMLGPRIGCSNYCVVDGIIYIIGGNYNEHNCQAYNPITNAWVEKTPIPPDGGGSLSATVYNGMIYTFGGSTYSPWAPLSTVYLYNPQTDTWTKKKNMPTPRFALYTCLVNGKIYAFGGAQYSGALTLATIEVYDPITDLWTQKANMPLNIAWLTGAVVNDNIYIISGSSDFGNTGNYSVWEYNPALDPDVPVELTSFTATANGKEVTLNWTTATELNNQGFEVQRKFGNNDFVTVGSVRGHGTTTSTNNYAYVDKLVDPGKYFYRLKQIDFGGTFEYSPTVEVDWSPFTTYKLEQNYPNPFNPTTKIGFGIPEKGSVRLSILNILGEEIRVLLNEEREAGYHSVDFNGSELPSGVYFYKLQAGNFVETKKMTLLR